MPTATHRKNNCQRITILRKQPSDDRYGLTGMKKVAPAGQDATGHGGKTAESMRTPRGQQESDLIELIMDARSGCEWLHYGIFALFLLVPTEKAESNRVCVCGCDAGRFSLLLCLFGPARNVANWLTLRTDGSKFPEVWTFVVFAGGRGWIRWNCALFFFLVWKM